MVIVGTMLKIVITMALGYFLFKIKVLNPGTNAAISKIIILASSPCLVFSSIMSMGSEGKGEVGTLLIVGLVIYAVFFLVAFPLVKAIRIPREELNTFLCMVVFGNVGFVGFPLAASLSGPAGLFYIGVLNVHFTIIAYTVGITLLTGKGHFRISNIINPATVGAVLALVLFLTGVKLPDVVLAPLDFIGQLTSPLAMLVLGSTIASYSPKKMFGNWRYYVISFVKLLVFPLAAFFIMRALIGNNEMTKMVAIYAGCPTATILPVMTLAYGGDWENTSSGAGLSHLLCIITVPALWLLMGIL